MPLAPDYYDDWREVLTELESQTDRGAAIVGAALLDAKIERALRLSFVPGLRKREFGDLFEGPVAPLGSFSGKVRVPHALGLIGDRSRADLKLIGKIRNEFAHKLEVKSFNESPINEWCESLSLADMTFVGQQPPTMARQRFVQAVVNIMHLLYSELVAGSPLGQKPSKSP